MMKHTSVLDPITITEPMVLIPAGEYETLLKEAGIHTTPILDKRIAEARKNFKKNKTVAWNKIKHAV